MQLLGRNRPRLLTLCPSRNDNRLHRTSQVPCRDTHTMRKPAHLILLFAAVLTLATYAVPLHGDDWPQWRGPTRDDVWRETGILDKFSGPQLPTPLASRRSAAATAARPWPKAGSSSPTGRPSRSEVERVHASTGRPAAACGPSPTTAPTRTWATWPDRGPASRSTRAVPTPWEPWGTCTASTRPPARCSGRSSRAWTTRSACRSGASPRPRWSTATW